MLHKHSTKKRINLPPSRKDNPPDMAIYTGSHSQVPMSIEVISYSIDTYDRYPITLDEYTKWNPDKDCNHWINVTGIGNAESIHTVCNKFGIHFLYQEDIMNVYQRPKLDEDESYVFTTFKELKWNDHAKLIEEEQYSIVIHENIILTFQEITGDPFETVREKLKATNSYYREKKVDYLFYRFLDIVVDNYFEVIEQIGTQLEMIEDEMIKITKPIHLYRIQENKKDLMMVRKNIYPMREMLNKVIAAESICIDQKTKKYFKDVSDHVTQTLDTIDTYREINISLKDVYLNNISYEMNRVMKVLTIMSTFFIPLTFIAGVYGMNFDNLPELHVEYGYYYFWIGMICIVVILAAWFKRRDWL